MNELKRELAIEHCECAAYTWNLDPKSHAGTCPYREIVESIQASPRIEKLLKLALDFERLWK